MTTDTLHDPDIGLVAALWRFIENSGSTEEFFELRARVRQHGALYDSAPALLEALEAPSRCWTASATPCTTKTAFPSRSSKPVTSKSSTAMPPPTLPGSKHSSEKHGGRHEQRSGQPPCSRPRPPFPARTVEITDEDESIVIAFVPVGTQITFVTTRNQPEKGKLP